MQVGILQISIKSEFDSGKMAESPKNNFRILINFGENLVTEEPSAGMEGPKRTSYNNLLPQRFFKISRQMLRK